jgi:hypothetical protein
MNPAAARAPASQAAASAPAAATSGASDAAARRAGGGSGGRQPPPPPAAASAVGCASTRPLTRLPCAPPPASSSLPAPQREVLRLRRDVRQPLPRLRLLQGRVQERHVPLPGRVPRVRPRPLPPVRAHGAGQRRGARVPGVLQHEGARRAAHRAPAAQPPVAPRAVRAHAAPLLACLTGAPAFRTRGADPNPSRSGCGSTSGS